MTRLLPLILLLCCLVGRVSKQKQNVKIKLVQEGRTLYRNQTPVSRIYVEGKVSRPDTVLWSQFLFYQDSTMKYGRTVAGKRDINSKWEIFDTAFALAVALSSLDRHWETERHRPVYIRDNKDTIILYPGDTIRLTTCKEDKTYFRTVKN